MISGNVPVSQIEEYLQELEGLRKQIDFLHTEINERLQQYRRSPGDEINTIILQGYIAYFERFIQPTLIKKDSSQKRYTEPSRRLTLSIDHDWRSYEFRQLFQGIDTLNKIFVLKTKLRKESPDLRIRQEMTRSRVYRYAQLWYYLTPHEEIQVTSIQFSSPGSINFEGLGDAVREIRELVHYVVTFQFVKGFVDVYDHFKYERPIQRAENRMKLKDVLKQEQLHERRRALQDLEEYRSFLAKMNEIADLAIELENKGLANGAIVEDAAIRSISYLNRLGFEQEKLKLPAPLSEQ